MSDENIIRDENLRLVLSKDHQAWLAREHHDRKNAFAILLFLFVICFGWMIVTLNAPPTNTDNTVYVEAGESPEVVQSLKDDGYDVIVGRAPTLDEGRGDRFEPFSYLLEHGFFAVIASLVIALFAARAWYELRRVKRWETDHESFLRERGHKIKAGSK